MQPKCSTSCSASTNNLSQTTAVNSTLLTISVERFKEICLLTKQGSLDQPDDIRSVLDYFFDPYKKLENFKTDFNLLKLYLTGGHSLDSFKTKCKY